MNPHLNRTCLNPYSNRRPLVCETSVITNYTIQTSTIVTLETREIMFSEPALEPEMYSVSDQGLPNITGFIKQEG